MDDLFTQRVMNKIDFGCLPDHMRDAARRYISDGLHPGSFFEAVLSNDLFLAIGKADHINKAMLSSYHNFLCTIPMAAKGSYEAVTRWCAHRGLKNLNGDNDNE